MDPFEVRMQFLALLRRLDASQQSIKKIVAFALKYLSLCGEDLWDCIVEECQKGSLNSRINVLYLLDSLCETCLLAKAHIGAVRDTGQSSSSYVDYLSRDLSKLVDYVVPPGPQGMPNLMSTVQVLDSWRSKRVIDSQKLDEVLSTLDVRRADASLISEGDSAAAPPLDPYEIKKRMEEDRERHKRLRERRWVQPISHNLLGAAAGLHPLASFQPLTDEGDGVGELGLDIEFDNEWETTSDWNEDDDEAVAEENAMCFPTSEVGDDEMDLS